MLDKKKYYSFEELRYDFEQRPDLIKGYKKAVRARRTAKVLGYTTIGLGGIALVGIAAADSVPGPTDCDLCLTSPIFAALASLFLVPFMGGGALITNDIGKNRVYRYILAFYGDEIRIIRTQNDWHLDMSASQQGVGLSLTFYGYM